MKLVFTKFVNLVPLEQCHHKCMGMYGGGFVMALLQWHMVYKLGEDELNMSLNMS